MTIEEIIKSHGGTVVKQSGESADVSSKPTSRIGEIIAANKEAADKQIAARNAPKAHGGASGKFGTDAQKDDGTVKIHALGAGETKPTTDRVGKTINAGVQGTMSNFTNFWGWLKESDAVARARDEADKEYTQQQNKELAETKGEKATVKTEEQQKQKYAENHAKQKDTWSKDYKKADKLSAMSEKNVAEAKEGLGKVGQALVDIGVVGTQMLGDAALNIIPGGGTASMVARVAGGSAQQARLEGKDIGQQSLSAIKGGSIAWLTEKMFGAFGKLYGKGAADDVVEAVVRKIGKSNAGRNFLRLGLNALGEGAEEITEDLLNAAADRALKLGDGELDLGEVLYDGFLGFALGGFGAGTQILNGNYRIKNEMQQRANAQKVLAKTVAENATDPETVKTAEAMAQKLKDGEMLTTAEVETLAGALEAATQAEEAAETVQQEEATPAEKKPLTPVEAIVRVAQGKVGNESEKLNIDNTANRNYTENINSNEQGGVPNDSNRVDRGMVDGVPEGQFSGGRDAGGRQDGRGYQGLSRRDLTQSVKRVLNDSGVVATELKDYSADSTAFSNALTAARAADAKNGWAVSPQDTNELQGKHLLMDANGTIGLAITSDGDVEAVFKNKALNKTSHAMDGVMPQAIAAGGLKLDCYGKDLVRIYEQYGFTPVARVEFNPKYANEGWTPDKGTPYIYFMMHNGDSTETVAANIGEYPHMERSQLEALPTFGKEEYDTAYAYRDELLAQQQSDLPEGMGAASAEFTGEMSPAEKWVAEAQAQGDSALHPISDEQQKNLTEQTAAEFEAEARLIRKRYKDKYGKKLSKEQQQELDSELLEAEKRIRRSPQELPKIDPMGNLTSKTAQTVMNSGVTPQEMSDAILNDAYDGRFSRIAYTDSEAINKAEDEIENGEGRYQGALSRWKRAVDRGEVSKDNVVMGICLYNNAVTNGDYITALDILDGLVSLGKNTGQALQAVRILNKLSPEGRLYVAAKAVDRINREVKKRYGDKAPDISVDEGLYADYCDALKSGDEAKIKSTWEAIQQNIADQITSSWIDKLNAWRYLAMLGNPRTHIRNILGNAFFSIPVMAKNVAATGIEAGVDKLSKNGIQRTKALLNPLTNKQDRALYATAMADYANASEQILAGGKYDDIFSGVSDKQTIFRFKPLEAVRKFNSKALDREDVWFAKPHYATALASYLKANGISAVEFTDGSMSETAMNEARNYAVKEAQKATFRDINAFSKMVSKIGKSDNKVVNAAASAVLPFKKTPANILVRGVEYSPAGLVKGLIDIRNIKTPNKPKGTKTAAEVIDEIATGLTGTGLVALGALLVRSGALTGGGGDDDKENKFQSMQGRQNYALVLPDGTTVTLDWLAPEVLPVFVGAELYNSLSGNGNSWESILTAISTIPQPMLDMSLLQSVNDLIDNVAYAKEGKGIYKIVAGMASSLLSQFVPTVLGQIERTIETERQQTFIDRSEGAPSSAVQSFWARLNDKNPLYDYNKIPYIDAWGRTEETGTFAERLVNNFINPAYVKAGSKTPIDDELKRLYDLGQTEVYPTKPGSNVKIDGEYLTADEYVKYAKERGEQSLTTATKVIRNPKYQSMTDAQKAKAIKYAYSYADQVAKLSINPNADVYKWVRTANGNPLDYIMEHSLD